ncbi:MAG TPA: hypothetical protein VM529_19190, partial [Gemmata sp.]|nr:hypothetical protein [Gemmata sp.]
PWAGIDALTTPAQGAAAILSAPAQPPDLVVPVEVPDEPKPAGRPARPHGYVSRGVVYALAGYALLITGVAVYGLFFRTPSLPADHPLSTIPDDFGEFPAANRKKVTAARFPLDGELPAGQKAALGGRIELGQIVIEPLKVEKRKLAIVRQSLEESRRVELGDALVLRLKVTNTSEDVEIYPLDPAFIRRPIGPDAPATRVVVGRESFAGGPINWPFGERLTREFEEQQADENTPLKPGESRDYFVPTAPNPQLVNAVRNAKDPVLWRVQVRRGMIDFRDRDVPVTAVVGVEFRASEVAGL